MWFPHGATHAVDEGERPIACVQAQEDLSELGADLLPAE